MESTDIVTSLKKLLATAQRQISPVTGKASPFVEGYIMGLKHAIELAAFKHDLEEMLR